MILGIDTAAAQCAVAVVGDRVVSDAVEMKRGHAEALFPMITKVLDQAGASVSDLTCIGVCTGPGSFTGIRVGIAAARGLALGRGIPVVGISRFEALAEDNGDVRLPGGPDRVYVQSFREGAAQGDPRVEEGAAEDRFADPVVIARLAAARGPGALRPGALYVREADAALPREAPPRILDAP